MSDSVDENLALTRRWYDMWNSGGVEAASEAWSPDIVFHEAPEFPETGAFRGIEAFTDHLAELVEDAGHFQLRITSLEGRGDYVLSSFEGSLVGPSSGLSVTTPMLQLIRYEGGRVIELRSYLDGDQARQDYERFTGSSG